MSVMLAAKIIYLGMLSASLWGATQYTMREGVIIDQAKRKVIITYGTNHIPCR